GDGRHAEVDIAAAAVQVELGDRGVARIDVDVDPAAAQGAAARIHARDAGVVGRYPHILVGGQGGLVDFAQAGVLARHQAHGRAGPGAAGGLRVRVAAVQLDLDAVLAVLQAARGKLEEQRPPVAARGALEPVAFAAVQAQ